MLFFLKKSFWGSVTGVAECDKVRLAKRHKDKRDRGDRSDDSDNSVDSDFPYVPYVSLVPFLLLISPLGTYFAKKPLCWYILYRYCVQRIEKKS